MRRKVAKKHRVLPDSRFGDVQVTVFVNSLMKDGKKSTAFKIFYSAIDKVSDKTGEDGLELFKKALINVTPSKWFMGSVGYDRVFNCRVWDIYP